jgi:hypothetical protein
MIEQGHEEAYRAAADAAMGDLDIILQESAWLRNRMDQLQAAVERLRPLMGSDEETLREQPRSISPSNEPTAEPASADYFDLLQPVGVAIPQLVPQRSRESEDPIQRRIDAVLARAVA